MIKISKERIRAIREFADFYSCTHYKWLFKKQNYYLVAMCKVCGFPRGYHHSIPPDIKSDNGIVLVYCNPGDESGKTYEENEEETLLLRVLLRLKGLCPDDK